MNWASWSDFWAMGGYAPYVWGSFGVVAATLAVEMLAIRARRNALRRLVADGTGAEELA
jgi:heme exporter protein D